MVFTVSAFAMIPRPAGGCGGMEQIDCSTNVSSSGYCCVKVRAGMGGKAVLIPVSPVGTINLKDIKSSTIKKVGN